MSQKLPVKGFKWVKNLSKFNEDFIKEYENRNTGYFLKWMQSIRKLYLILIKIYHFYWKEKKVEKLICSIEDKEKYVVHIKALKQVLNYDLKVKKVQRVIQFYQKAWLKPYIDMNTELRKNAKNGFENNFFNNSVFGKTMENVRNHRDIKLVISDKRRKLSFT